MVVEVVGKDSSFGLRSSILVEFCSLLVEQDADLETGASITADCSLWLVFWLLLVEGA